MSIGKRLKSINIGDLKVGGNIFLAPLAGYSDMAFRQMCLRYGADLAFTEMVSCKGLIYGSEKTAELLKFGDSEKIKAAQIFGCEPDIMREACMASQLSVCDLIDINMGCPVPKVYSNGEGSALLNKPELAAKIVQEVKKAAKRVTVKIRTGAERERKVTAEFCTALAEAGADMITVHGRTRQDYYSGEPDYDEIARAVNAVKIPVIANGGIFSEEDEERMFANTGCDGIMIARAALYEPFIFAKLKGKEIYSFKEEVIKQIETARSVYGDRRAAVNLRKQLACYLKGVRDGKRYKEKIFALESCGELIEIAKQIF